MVALLIISTCLQSVRISKAELLTWVDYVPLMNKLSEVLGMLYLSDPSIPLKGYFEARTLVLAESLSISVDMKAF